METPREEISFNFRVIHDIINLVYYSDKAMQGRDSKGRFSNKSDFKRKVRTFRATDEVWEKLGIMADDRGITRADFIEEFVITNRVIHGKPKEDGVEILREALRLRANAGGAIKKKIKEYLNLFI